MLTDNEKNVINGGNKMCYCGPSWTDVLPAPFISLPNLYWKSSLDVCCDTCYPSLRSRNKHSVVVFDSKTESCFLL